MFKALKSFLDDAPSKPPVGQERRHLQVAVASLLHEASRVDLDEAEGERAAAGRALEDLFGLDAQASAAVLAEGREKARHLTSYFGPVSVIKREWGPAERARLVDHLWRVAYADGPLDQYEDHYVRKIGHLLYVSNTDMLLARNRARAAKG